MGWPVVVVDSGGVPVTEAKNGLGTPVTVVGNGLGTAVTIVAAGGLPVVGLPAFDPDAAALMDRMTTPPTNERAEDINALVVALKEAGVWSKLDVLYVFAAADAQAARLNWKSSSYTATPVNAPTFTADRGYQGDGASSYVDANFNPATAGGLFAQNSAHIGVWSRTDVQQAAGDIGSANSFFTCRSATNTFSHRVNGSSTLNTAAGSVTDSSGHFVSSRTLAASCRPFRNGVALAAEQTLASTAPDSNSIRLLGRAGTVQYSARQLAVAHIGSGLSSADIAAMYTPILTYLQAVGAA